MAIRRKRRRFPLIFLVTLTALTLLVIYFSVGLDVDECELTFDTLPQGFDGMRIVQISDLHGAEFGEDYSELLSAVDESGAELICVTGDLVDCEEKLDSAVELMRELAARCPVLYIPGNHEWSVYGIEDFFDRLSEVGVVVMLNKYYTLSRGGDKILVVGVNDPCGYSDQITPEELMAQAKAEYPNLFTLVLYHRNDRAELFAECGAQLLLSGHAHGGLIRLPFTDGLVDSGRRLFPTNTNGAYSFGDMTMYVSRGLGNSVWVPRILNRPHLPVITLTAK